MIYGIYRIAMIRRGNPGNHLIVKIVARIFISFHPSSFSLLLLPYPFFGYLYTTFSSAIFNSSEFVPTIIVKSPGSTTLSHKNFEMDLRQIEQKTQGFEQQFKILVEIILKEKNSIKEEVFAVSKKTNIPQSFLSASCSFINI